LGGSRSLDPYCEFDPTARFIRDDKVYDQEPGHDCEGAGEALKKPDYHLS
jgi:hypothetical protein